MRLSVFVEIHGLSANGQCWDVPTLLTQPRRVFRFTNQEQLALHFVLKYKGEGHRGYPRKFAEERGLFAITSIFASSQSFRTLFIYISILVSKESIEPKHQFADDIRLIFPVKNENPKPGGYRPGSMKFLLENRLLKQYPYEGKFDTASRRISSSIRPHSPSERRPKYDSMTH
jgi:hypothetical protein